MRLRVVALAAVFAVAFAPAAGGDPYATRVFDRTFSCESGYVGGLHQVSLGIEFAAAPGSSRLSPSAGVTRDLFEAALGHVSGEGLTVHRQRCTPVKANVRLTTKGMRGGAVPALGAEARCETPRRLLLRLRGEFAAPPITETVRQFGFPQLVVRGQVKRAQLVIGTPVGKPIAYAALTDKGDARLFTVRTCEED